MKKLVIIPAYNEQDSIEQTVQNIRECAPDFDYLVINDGSTDDTLAVCLRAEIPCLNLPVNLGIGGTVQAGYLYGIRHGYDLAVQIDGDGQHDAAYLDQMAQVLAEDQADMVIGSRLITKEGFQSSVFRRIGIRHFSMLIRLLTGATITDPTSGMRMVNRKVMRVYATYYPKDYPEPESAVQILTRGYRIREIPVIMRERNGGVSSINLKNSVYYMVKVTLSVIIARFRK